jgi:hypothetical protein
MSAARQTAPTNAMRAYWSSTVLATCLRHAALLRIIDWPESGDTSLQQLPPAIHPVVFAKCQDLIDRACKAEAEGYKRNGIERRANGELWDFLKTWRRDDVAEARRGQTTWL